MYISQVLDGLLYLHEQGVIHRDIKGANILTTKDGSVKLADFGVATKTGAMNEFAVVGSPYWMAPEVIDQSGATTTSDIWSVGCVVVELLEGKPPYSYLDPMPALFRIVQDDCPPLPESASPVSLGPCPLLLPSSDYPAVGLQVVKDFLMHCFQKDSNLRVSARKLLRHPWMINAKRQLEQMRGSGSTKLPGPAVHDEAVKTVQEWNQILKGERALLDERMRQQRLTSCIMSADVPQPVKSKEPAQQSEAPSAKEGTIRMPQRDLPRRPRDQLRAPLTPSLDQSTSWEPEQSAEPPKELLPSQPLPSRIQRIAPAQSLVEQPKSRYTEDASADNWDGDFEDDIPTTKIAAARVQLGSVESSLTSKTQSEAKSQSTRKEQHKEPVRQMEDYSDDFADGEDGTSVSMKLQGLPGASGPSLSIRSSNTRSAQPVPGITERPPRAMGEKSAPQDLRRKASASLSPPCSRSGSMRGSASKAGLKKALDQYTEMTSKDDYENDFEVSEDFGLADLTKALKPLPLASRSSKLDAEDDLDPFSELEEEFPLSEDFDANIARDKYAKMCQYVSELAERLERVVDEPALVNICDELVSYRDAILVFTHLCFPLTGHDLD